ncbi:MAG: entericidin A/B family lipoprotein [Burkholderiaceae bacterium]|jgi:predicted small secreted protein|nr:entericidin A/B family lipoprotein [Burkholderiaceae bacterium]MEB2318229.1 entericidin A/B family lipoprotein [Pseudomonadota bacterium]
MTRLLMLAIASMFALSACNTMSGLGQDIEAGGNKLENAAEKGKRSN